MIVRKIHDSISKEKLKKVAHPALFHALKRRGRVDRSRPLLSVIIPVYGVEKYIATSLDSIVAQSYTNLEIIIVDDESPDNSYKIAKTYARWDKRIKIIRKKNGGLGAARNTGIQQAKGEYITFADSDDVVTEGAYEHMVNTLEKSGSDFAVGAMQRIHHSKAWLPQWVKDTHSTDRIGITFDSLPDIMYDVFAWNKVFRREFFLEKVRHFPEGIRYEDQEPSLIAYLNAEKFDVLKKVVYSWYVRDDGKSISQQKEKVEDIRDRLTVNNKVNQILKQNNVSREVYGRWLTKALGLDMRAYFELVPRRDIEYWRVMRDGLRKLLDGVSDSFLENLDIHDRSLIWALKNNQRDDITSIISSLSAYGRDYRLELDRRESYGVPDYYHELNTPLPRHLLKIGDDQLMVVQNIHDIRFTSKKVIIKGAVYINELPNGLDDGVSVSLVSLNTNKKVEPIKQKYGQPLPLGRGRDSRYVDHQNAGFYAEFSLQDLEDDDHPRWMVKVDYKTQNRSFEIFVNRQAESTPATYQHFSDRVHGYIFTHKLSYIPDAKDSRFLIIGQHDRPSDRRHLMQYMSQGYDARVTDFSLDSKRHKITVEGIYQTKTKQTPRFVFANDFITNAPVSVQCGAGTFKLTFLLNTEGDVPRSSSLPLKMIYTNRLGLARELWVPVSEGVNDKLPQFLRGDRYNLQITRTARAAAFNLSITPPFKEVEMGRYGQRCLQDEYLQFVSENNIHKNTFFFETFNGTRADDSPLSLSEEIQKIHPNAKLYYWSIEDYSVEVPKGMKGVVRYTRQWYELLATCEYLVNNNNFPFFFKKAKGQIYIQTWHGTPLKKIGNDVPGLNLSMQYRQLMKKEATEWDYLLAQNEFARTALPRAFGYKGRVVMEGYPRNDNLVHTTEKEQETIRRSLGIKKGQKVILYAPTWRDTAKNSNGGYQLVNYLDTRLVNRQLPGYTVLLRGHPNTLKSKGDANDNVIDVRNHPRINELFKAADILITDYSSVMFDFAVTKKPIFFLAPDIETYGSSTRGFYLNLKDVAPGPIGGSTREIIRQIKTFDSSQYSDRYERFTERFCSLDDGKASSWVLENTLRNRDR